MWVKITLQINISDRAGYKPESRKINNLSIIIIVLQINRYVNVYIEGRLENIICVLGTNYADSKHVELNIDTSSK